MDSAIRRTTEHREEHNGISHANWRTCILQMICLLAQNFKTMTQKFVDLNTEVRKAGMYINHAKTKALRINDKHTNTIPLEENN
jgi:hypothetical protein